MCSDSRVLKVRPNELMFAPFAHIKGSLFTLYALVLGYTTHIMPRFNFSAYLRHISFYQVITRLYDGWYHAFEVNN